MKNYYIYHIEGIKIGCTSDINLRTKEYEASGEYYYLNVIEEYTDIYIASNREIELQKQWGYPVDTLPYWKVIENRSKTWNGNNGRKGAPKLYKLTREIADIIRIEYRDTNTSHRKLAAKYDISKQSIGRILRNQGYIA